MFLFKKTILVADSIHGNIQISNLEKEILSTQAFNRLHNISQNSTVYLTFPSNRTKRFEHSLGSMHLAGEIFFYSMVNADEEARDGFLQKAMDEVNTLLTDSKYSCFLRVLLGKDEKLIESCETISIKDPLYLLYVPKIIKDEYVLVYTLLFQAIRCAALLHDLGHPPFSHVTEAALEEIWENALKVDEEKRTSRQNLFIETMNHYLIEINEGIVEKPGFALHEKVGNRIADRLFEAIINSSANPGYKLFICMVHKFVSLILLEKNEFFKSVHSIIAGSIDCDRLDYIVRDLNNSGFNHGRIEYDRLITSFKLMKAENSFLFCADIRALSTMEDFYNKRMRLYKFVIYHHRVIKTDNLLKLTIVKLAQDYLAEGECENLEHTQVLPLDISGVWKAVKEEQLNQKYFNALIQWDDGWLLAVLRQQYYDKYIESTDNVKYQLEELLSNQKNYSSIVKRFADFLEIDEEVANNLNVDFNQLQVVLGDRWEKLILPIKHKVENYQKTEGFLLSPIAALFRLLVGCQQ